MAGRLNRGDVHLCRFAPPDKQRPVLILTRDSAVGHLSTVTVAPISTTVRGVPSEVLLDIDDGVKGRCAVNLHNAVTISRQRLGKRVANSRLDVAEQQTRRGFSTSPMKTASPPP